MVEDALIKELEEKLMSLDRIGAKEILYQATGSNPILGVIEQLIVPVMEKIGKGWESGSVSLSQVYMSSRICEGLIDEILPPAAESRQSHPRMAICVLEDYHMMGKRIVYSQLRAAGFELQDWGRVSVEQAVELCLKETLDILLISVLMLPSALRVQLLVDQLREEGSRVKFVVGGAPFRFDNSLVNEVGVNAMGNTAVDAVNIVKDLTLGAV